MTAAWIYLSVAVLVEETWGLSLKAAAVMELGKWFCGVTVGLSLLSMWLLILVMRDLPAGLAYGIWTCLGTVGITLGGWLLFKETLTGGQIFFLALCITGVAGLKLTSASKCSVFTSVHRPPT